ncbi:alpha/beta hydrolase [Halovulum sp. GXIMD14793]
MTAEPPGYAFIPGTSARTLILLPGGGTDRHDMTALGQRVDSQASLLVLDNPEPQSAFRQQALGPRDQGDLISRCQDVASSLHWAIDHAGIDLQNATAIGYHDGASLLTHLVLTGTCPITRIVAWHPTLPVFVENRPNLSDYRMLITGGALDPVAPAQWTRKLADGLRDAGARLSIRMHNGGQELSDTELDWTAEFLNDLGQGQRPSNPADGQHRHADQARAAHRVLL